MWVIKWRGHTVTNPGLISYLTSGDRSHHIDRENYIITYIPE